MNTTAPTGAESAAQYLLALRGISCERKLSSWMIWSKKVISVERYFG